MNENNVVFLFFFHLSSPLAISNIISSGDWKRASGNFVQADTSCISFAIMLAT